MRKFLLPALLVAGFLTALALAVAGGGHRPVLRLGTNVWPGYETLYLARQLGYLDDGAVRLVEMRSATDVMQLLRSGGLEAAALTLDETLSVAQDGFDLGVVLVMDLSRGGDVLLARPGIDTLADLRGRRIGVESSAVGAILLDGALEAAGLAPEAVEIAPLRVDEGEAAYRQGRIDAVVTFEPVATRLREAGAVVLFSSREIPDRIVDVLVVRRDLVGERGAALRRLVAAHFRALAYLRRHPREAARSIAPRVALAPAQVLQAYAGLHLPSLEENRDWLAGDYPRLVSVAETVEAILRQHGLLRRAVAVGQLPEPAYLPGETL